MQNEERDYQLELADQQKRMFYEFIETIAKEIFSEREYEVREVQEVLKANGCIEPQISIRPLGSAIAMSIDIDPFFEDFLRTDADAISEKLQQLVTESMPPQELNTIAADIMNPEWVDQHLTVRVLNREINEDLLQNSVWRPAGEDLAEIAYLNIDVSENGLLGSARVTPSLLSAWQLSRDEVLDRAEQNLHFSVQSMQDKIRSLAQETGVAIEDDLFVPNTPPIWVISTPDTYYGASILACPEKLREIIESTGTDCYIIPSSVHEVILVDKQTMRTVEDLNDLIFDVNNQNVASNEILANHAYEYDFQTNQIRTAGFTQTATRQQPQRTFAH